MMLGGDSARFATTTAKHHLLQMSQAVQLTIKPRGNKEAEIIEGTADIAAKLSTIQKEYKEYVTIVFDKIIQRRGACKCLIDIQTDIPTNDALRAWEAYLAKADVKLSVVTEKEEIREEMKKALWFSGVQARHCNKAVVKRNIERLLSEKGMDMPIEVIDCYHALPVDVTENGVISQQKLGTGVLALKTRKEDVNVLVGNVTKMINQEKINVFNDPEDLSGIVNPHPIVHAIPFRANNRFQHLLLSKHKQYMDTHKVQFFLRENVDKVITGTRLDDHHKGYPHLPETDNTLRRIIMALANSQGNQVAEAIYSTQRKDYIISCEQENSKVIADYCDLHALDYRNMWDKFDPNYESEMAKDMKALVAEIEVEENGFYMAPGKVVQASQIAPSAWKKKPKIVADQPGTSVAIRTELKRTEDIIYHTVSTAIEKLVTNHETQLRTMREQHIESMQLITKKCEDLTTHAQNQGEMIDGLLQRNDNDQLQMTEGFEKIDKNITANEQSIETIFQDMLKIQEVANKDRHTVVKSMQQNMDTTTKAFKILSDEMTIISSEVQEMSQQADELEESLTETADKVDAIFNNFVSLRGRGGNRNKRERSRSVSSAHSTLSTQKRVSKRQQRGSTEEEEEAMDLNNGNSSDDQGMDDLDEIDEMEEQSEPIFDLEEKESDDEQITQTQDDEQSQVPTAQAQVVSGSPQDEDPRKE